MKETLYEVLTTWGDTLESLDYIEDENEKLIAQSEVNELMSGYVKEKGLDIVKYNANLSVKRAMAKKEIERLNDIVKSIDRKQEVMDKAIKYAMDKFGLKKIETGLGNISLTKNPLSVELDDKFSINDIDKEYVRVKTTKELDKTAIKDLYKKEGIMIQGVKYINDKETIRYK